jgi:hypothetical protein
LALNSASVPNFAPPVRPEQLLIGSNWPPLSRITRSNRPRASGLAASRFVLHEPADSPKIVTRLRVPAECRDILLDPLKRGDLIEQAVIARNGAV